MCGICGFYGFDDKSLLNKMCSSIKHRGPDNQGKFVDNKMSLGYRRLTIIDTKEQKQPILHNEKETIFISFNGELYNYLPLRNELENKGHKFYTKTDTETIIHLYEEKGESFLQYLRGMFAFALWDSRKKKLILARDKFGKKPLYYTFVKDGILFASEIKALLLHEQVKRQVNIKALNEFLTFRFAIAPNTLFKDIFMLPPSHYLVYKDKKYAVKKYYDFSINVKDYEEGFCIKKIRTLLRNAVEMRLMSDVPLGAFLSGGHDSSYIVALMAQFSDEPIKTFSVGFNDDTDELKYANIIAEAFKTAHKELHVDADQPFIIPEITWHLDSPAVDVASIPTYLMSKLTSKHVKVVLTGDGGDEVFGGYNKYRFLPFAYRYHKFSPNVIRTKVLYSILKETRSDLLNRLGEFIANMHSKNELYLTFVAAFTEKEKKEICSGGLKKQFNKIESISNKTYPFFNDRYDFLSQMQYFDVKTLLPDDYLMKVDKMTMAHGLEARVPMLDVDLVEFMFTLKPELKIKGMNTRYIYRKVISDLLPQEIIRRKKHGFNIPTNKWLDGELKEIALQVLNEKNLAKSNYFNVSYVAKILRNYRKSERYYSRQFWSLFTFDVWHKIYIENEIKKPKLNFNKLY